ncbi:hypothetical protein Poli38472_006765 [Pythium oligandrum]|uniref:Uncharacterized protein n=1 Tax=Pythium oligandrum TaxID=41045 RepID=A0A8K1C5E2_PYTOL|nr:hypothetical protein Poli38472_006765 [Pythium oligandrum]|eukprot:TMW56755.1 hypothetical protein Poli38472_006765 [Pythium oligandrum]
MLAALSESSAESDAKTDTSHALSSPSSPEVPLVTRSRSKKRPITAQESARRREWERKSRERRRENNDKMREQVKTLECALANIMFVRERTDVEEEVDDDESVRMRKFLRACVEFKDDILALEQERGVLRRKLLEYQQFESIVRLRLRETEMDDWPLCVLKWRAITYATFRPWTLAQCQSVLDGLMQHIQTYELRDDLVSSGMTFGGWREKRRLDKQTSTLQFSFDKDYVPQDLEFTSEEYWRIYLDGDEYGRMMVGPNVKTYYEVIQEITPDLVISRCVGKYPDLPINFHMLSLVFRIRTATGIIQGMTSIPSDDLDVAVGEEDAVWVTSTHWQTLDALQRDENGRCAAYKTSVNGTTISTGEPQFVYRWMTNSIMTVIRAESMIMGRRLLC